LKNSDSSLRKILNAFVITMVFTISLTLIASGIAISKVNTDYMSTGIHAAKIIAERNNEEIFISINGQRLGKSSQSMPDFDKILSLCPAPINTIYILITEIFGLINP